MQTLESSQERKVRRYLEHCQDAPPTIEWERLERTITPLVEVCYGGRSYLPSVRTADRKGQTTVTPAQVFLAAFDSELESLWATHKISIAPPWVTVGKIVGPGERVYRPWENCFAPGELPPVAFGSSYVRVRLQKFVQVLPHVAIKPGSVFWIPWQLVAHNYGPNAAFELVDLSP